MELSRTAKAAILGTGQVAAAVSSILIAVVLSRLFTKDDYATFRQTVLVYNVAAPILTLGLPQALYFFVPQAGERERGIVLENILLLGVFGLAASVFFLLGGNKFVAAQFGNPGLEKTLLVFAPYMAMMAPSAALAACMMSFNRARSAAYFNIVTRGLTFLIVVAAALYFRSPVAAVAGLVAGGLLTVVPALWMMIRAPRRGRWRVSASGASRQLRFSIPLGLAVATGILTLNMDKLLVAYFFPNDVFAVYVNGAFEIPLVAVVTSSASSVLMVELSGLMKVGEPMKALAIWQRSAVKTAGLLFPLMAGLMLLAPEVMTLLFSEEYVASAMPFRVYLTLLLIRCAFFGVLMQASGQSRLVLRYSLVSLALNGVVSVALIHWIGFMGAAVGSSIVLLGFTAPYCCHLIRRHVLRADVPVMPLRGLSRVLAGCLLAMAAGFGAKALAASLGGGFAVSGLVSAIVFSVIMAVVAVRLQFVDFARLAEAGLAMVGARPRGGGRS